MTKRAVILAGPHASGKSRLIRQFIKPLFGMSENQMSVLINKRKIWIKSQTLQESRTGLSSLDRFASCDSLILPSWPTEVGKPSLNQIREKLRAIGFRVSIVDWTRADDDSVCRQVVQQIYDTIMQ